MKNRRLLLTQIDKQIKPWQALSLKKNRPKIGWVRTLRTALGMTSQELATRMGLKHGRILQLEKAEIADAITLRSLKSVAHAMDCELIYAIVPKISLIKMLKTKAREVACRRIGRVSHSMTLEAQALTKKQQAKQFSELVKELLEGSPKKLWRE